VHIKDFSNSDGALTLIGNGDIPIIPIVNQLLSDGYDGYFSLEWEKKWHPELPEIESALARYRALLAGLCEEDG
jgi:sugar phosphate isomerase/epimerase